MQVYRSDVFKAILLLLTLTVAGVVTASVRPNVPVPDMNGIKLIENKGQWDAAVLFKANIPGGDLYITGSGFVYRLIDEAALHRLSHGNQLQGLVKGHTYKMSFENGNTVVAVEKQSPSYESYNYFLGDDPSHWAGNCKAYQSVILKNIYDGIDAEIIAKSDFIKLNFIVHAHANPDLIRLVYEGMDAINIKEQSLFIQTCVASIKEEKPVAFQGTDPVPCHYSLESNRVHFELGSYNTSQPLIIDPEIVFGTYSGSVADNFGFTGTYDEAGNGFAGGTVYSSGFPVTVGAFQLNFAGGSSSGTSARDMGILKFSADGKKLLYATYLGGNHNEQPHSLVCNSAGELYIMGTTQSANFPTSLTAFDRTYNGAVDIVVCKLSADGTKLLASTYWGGVDNDGINGTQSDNHTYRIENPLTYNYGDFYRGEILLDAFNQVYVASATQSNSAEGYPILSGFQGAFGGGVQDGIIFSLSANLSGVNFSTYLGGNGEDAAYGIRFDSEGNMFVTGGTTSNNIGKNNGTAFLYKGFVDGFIAKIALTLPLNLTNLLYLGTPQYDQSYFIDLDPSDHVYVTGQTMGNYPLKGNVYKNANSNQFISILNKGLDSMMYSTVIGNGSSSVNISPSAFMVDKCGKIYLSGWGGSSNLSFNDSVGFTFGLTVTPDAFQPNTDGSDFYLIILSENLAALKYATFLGGRFSSDHVDGGTSRFDKKGMVYQSICAGCGGFSDLPVTPGCYSPTNNGIRPNGSGGGCNNALIKFNADPYNYPPMIKDTLLVVTATDTIDYGFTVTNPIGDSLVIDFTGAVLNEVNPPVITQKHNGNTANIRLHWITQCNNASTDTFVIEAKTQANGCFGFKTETAIIRILVKNPPPIIPPYPNCLKTINDSTIRISWAASNYGRYFKQMAVYKSTGGAPFVLIGQNTQEKDTVFIDTKAHNHLTENICYYFAGTNICDSVSSFPSRFVCSLYPYDSADHIFNVPNDTVLYITATDTLDYTFKAETQNTEDSVFITATGSVFTTNRVLLFSHQPKAHKANYRIVWRSACDDLKSPDTLTVRFLVRDNQCPQSRTKQSLLKIIVVPPPVADPPQMKCTRNTGPHSVLVRWSKPTVNRYFSHFVLLRKNADGSFTEIQKIYHDSALLFEDKTAFNNETENTCYAGYAVNVCGLFGDTSMFVCTVIKTTTQPDPLYIYTTTVVENNFINVQWAKSNDPNFLKYQVFKKNAVKQGGFTFLHETQNINDTTINDQSTDVHQYVYCYQLKQVNDCGVSNEDAYHACSILLKGKSEPFLHTLSWNDYDFWRNGVNNYALVREQPDMDPETLNRYAYKNTNGEDKNLNKDNGLYHYTIKAQESKSVFTSVSNTIKLIQAPLLHVPNVFTANGDGLNDLWQPVPAFVKEYNLKIYDRWGKLVFETLNKKEPFTGWLQGNSLTSDVFVYLITYTGWDGSVHTVTGNVTQLK